MNILSILYNLFIMPIQIIVEMIYSIVSRIYDNKGIVILVVCFVIRLILVPLNKRFEAFWEEEDSKQYDKNIYKIIKYLPALMELLAFCAVYVFFSELEELKGERFLFVNDLSLPDAKLFVGGFKINILPVLMILSSVIFGMIYSRKKPIRVKVQLYGMSALFFVALYKSPSGLVLYWIFKNLFASVKYFLVVSLRDGTDEFDIVKFLRRIKEGNKKKGLITKTPKKFFLWEMIFLALFMGGIIPTLIITLSPTEFITNEANPIIFIINALTVYMGLFLVWGMTLYYIFDREKRVKLEAYLLGFIFMTVFNYVVYIGKYGVMNSLLVFQDKPKHSIVAILINLILVIFMFIIAKVLVEKDTLFLKLIFQLGSIAMIGLICILGFDINRKVNKADSGKESDAATYNNIISLSTEGQNVVLVMLDRGITAYLPYIFQEYPEIAAMYEDFTYYPNTLTFAAHTNMATPAIFGGYEYTPSRMNERDAETLKSKHNEALLLLPELFSANGYQVTVCDPPYANYEWIPDLSIYDDLKNTSAYITKGVYNEKINNLDNDEYIKKQADHFIFHSITQTTPLIFYDLLYNSGRYNSRTNGTSIDMEFVNNYSSITSLKEMTSIVDDNSRNLFMYQNCTTHDTMVLEPETLAPLAGLDVQTIINTQPKRVIDGRELTIDTETEMAHYQCNVAALKALGEWLSYMKEMGVYDNTRIVIVSDHGFDFNQFDDLMVNADIDVEYYSALLMFKDFDASGYKIDDKFMTTADVPVMLLDGIVENPVNPFTGVAVTDEEKYSHPQKVTTSNNYNVEVNNGNVYDVGDSAWYQVKDDIYNPDNWIKIEE